MITITFTNTGVGVQHSDEFIPTMGSEGPHWGPVEIMCLCLCPYVSMSLCISFHVAFWRSFLRIIIARSACVHSPWGQIPCMAI